MSEAEIILSALERGLSFTVTTRPDGQRSLRVGGIASTGKMSAAEKQRAYRQRQKSVTGQVTPEPGNVTSVTSVTDKSNAPSPSLPSPSSPEPPPSPAHPPTPAKGAPAHTHEEADFSPETMAPHKRIRWDAATGWAGILPTDREQWAKAYPACDIDRQLAAMGTWLLANPTRARKSNFCKFVTGWLTKSQDHGGDTRAERRYAEPAKETVPTFNRWENKG